MITLKMHFLNYKFNDKIIANGVIWYYTKYIEVAGPKKPSAESQWFDARDRANKNVKAEKRSVPLHSCTGLRQKPEMRRWRGNHKEGIVIRPIETWSHIRNQKSLGTESRHYWLSLWMWWMGFQSCWIFRYMDKIYKKMFSFDIWCWWLRMDWNGFFCWFYKQTVSFI